MTVGKNKNCSSKHEIDYVMEGLAAFHKLRSDGWVLLNAYIGRLSAEVSSLSMDFKILMQPEGTSFLCSWLTDRLKSMGHRASHIFNFIRLIPSFITQKRKLDLMRHSPEVFGNAIIAVDSRLYSIKSATAPRQYLISLTKSFPNHSNKPSIADEIASSKYILIFDPLPFNPSWKNKEVCWKDNIFIVDVSFSLFLAFVYIFKIAALYILNYLRNRVFCQALKTSIVTLHSFISVIAASVITEAYKEVMNGPHSMKAFFFTSDSFATEILRMCLIQNDRCVAICEILHGVPTTDFEHYVATLLHLGTEYGAGEKHYFIPQIPDLPMHEIFKSQTKSHSTTSINAYLNRYLIEHQSANLKLTDFLESEYNAIFSGSLPIANTLIISFTGGILNDQRYFRSEPFRIECIIMLLVKDILNSIQQPFVIIYTPHPAHTESAFFQCPFFSDEQIIVYRDTILTWFISDMCISLFSSALFEAAYFGVNSFTPMIESDHIYTNTLLDLLNYHGEKNEICFIDELKRFIISHTKRPSADILLRAKVRLGLL